MGERDSKRFETLNPQQEFIKFMKMKPVVSTANMYEGLQEKEKIKCPQEFKGYGIEKGRNYMYSTTNSEYGYYPPTQYTIPTRHHALTQTFTNEQQRFGQYRIYSLNTAMDYRNSK